MNSSGLIRKRKAILAIFIPVSISREHLYYGGIKKAKVLEIEAVRHSNTKGGGVPTFSLFMKTFDSGIVYDDLITVNFDKESPLRRFKNEVEIGDTVTIKVLNKSQAKILEHKKQEVQPYNSYSNLFWYYLVILFLMSLVILPYYVLIKYRK